MLPVLGAKKCRSHFFIGTRVKNKAAPRNTAIVMQTAQKLLCRMRVEKKFSEEASMEQTTAKNPIRSGFYPDPSVCRVGQEFYLVTSSFACFPGIPIFKSRDLAHWEQIGNVLNRNSQIPLDGCGHSGGIYAPTIRYHDGLFYVITTNVSAAASTGNRELAAGNFIVTAKKPEGPWSEPYYLGEAADGIDPSLFFDEDGACYYCGTRPNSKGAQYDGDMEIWVQRLDLDTMKLTGESAPIWNGALKNAIWAEGPHIYKIDGWYYVLHAEGGTGPDHCVAVARSRCITGPYTGYPSNPILTHRHLGKEYPVRYVGHAELVEIPASMTVSGKQKWYLVCLASRPLDGHTLLGRETFLAEVVWEDGWPVINPGIGRLTEELFVDLPKAEAAEEAHCYAFESEALPPEMILLRNPDEASCSLQARKGFLRLWLKPVSLKDCASPSFIGVRQRQFDFDAAAALQFIPHGENEAAGLVLLQSNQFHLKIQIVKKGEKTAGQAVFVKAPEAEGAITGDAKELPVVETLLAEKELGSLDMTESYVVKLSCRGLYLSASVVVNHAEVNRENIPEKDLRMEMAGDEVLLAKDIFIGDLSTEVAGGFVGNLIGMFASACDAGITNPGSYADFAWFFVS